MESAKPFRTFFSKSDIYHASSLLNQMILPDPFSKISIYIAQSAQSFNDCFKQSWMQTLDLAPAASQNAAVLQLLSFCSFRSRITTQIQHVSSIRSFINFKLPWARS